MRAPRARAGFSKISKLHASTRALRARAGNPRAVNARVWSNPGYIQTLVFQL